ncbi:MAG: ABC transporter substrate-binding protein [Anaerolineales bacterium]|nr:ABC transporter substrate-binding protein [Anaerolineales bacterium]
MPSITESLFDLGAGGSLVAVTDYCIHPAEPLSRLPRIGGTKNPRVEDIIALQPDLVFANQEENTPAAVGALQAAGIRVRVHFPRTVEQAVADLAAIARLYSSQSAAEFVAQLATKVAAARAAAPEQPLRVFCPIWQDEAGEKPWWMTFNAGTFTHDILALCGFANAFAGRQRRYPLAADLGQGAAKPAGERDTRYPRVTREEVLAAGPQVILLPSEPYEYGAEHVDALARVFAGTPAAQSGRIRLIDGSLLTWPGTRLGRAIEHLAELRARLE